MTIEFDSLRGRQLIGLWADKAFELERYFRYHDILVHRRDPKFLAILGDSVYRINKYNTLLLDHIQRQTGLSEDEKERLRNFCEFHNDLVVSKIKHFFFKELPNQNLDEPSLRIDRDIYEQGRRLWELSEDRQAYMASYFYQLGLFYAFLYDSYKNEGVFLHFRYDRNDFHTISRLIKDKIHSIVTEQELRQFSTSIIPKALCVYLDGWGHKFKDESPTIRKIYAEFVQKFAQDINLFIEPLTWHLFDIIGKVDGYIQDSLEFLDEKEKKKADEKIIQIVVQFIQSSLELYQEMYDKGMFLPDELFKRESDFIKSIREEVFQPSDRQVLLTTLKSLEEFADKVATFSVESIGTLNNELTHSILAKLRNFSEEGLKMEYLIESLDTEELLAVLQSYSKMFLDDKTNRFEDVPLVGFYSSGVFLAHIARLFHEIEKKHDGKSSQETTVTGKELSSDSFTQIVWMFKAFPYVSTHPNHEDDPNDQLKKIIICDESVKTGFSYSIYEVYIKRHLPNIQEFSIYTLFDHRNYIKLDTLLRPNTLSLFQVKNIHDIYAIMPPVKLMKPRMKITWTKDEFKENLIRYLAVNGRCDFTWLIASTPLSLAIARWFADQILSKCHHGNVFLFSPSQEGRVLAMLTAFWLKMDGIAVYFRIECVNDEMFRVLIDLTEVTGFTADCNWRLEKDDRKADPKRYFDLTLYLPKLSD